MKWRSKSFKVIDFSRNRKPIYDFLLVINCHLSSISHRFRDIASRIRKPSHPRLSSRSMEPIRISQLNLSCYKLKFYPFFGENRVIQTLVMLSVYTRATDNRRQAPYHENSRSLQWNCYVRLKTIFSLVRIIIPTLCIKSDMYIRYITITSAFCFVKLLLNRPINEVDTLVMPWVTNNDIAYYTAYHVAI